MARLPMQSLERSTFCPTSEIRRRVSVADSSHAYCMDHTHVLGLRYFHGNIAFRAKVAKNVEATGAPDRYGTCPFLDHRLPFSAEIDAVCCTLSVQMTLQGICPPREGSRAIERLCFTSSGSFRLWILGLRIRLYNE